MTKRIFTAIVCISVVAVIVCSILTMGVVYDFSGTWLENELKKEAEYIESGIKTDTQQYLDAIKKNSNRVTLIAADGSVLYDSRFDSGNMENHMNRDEIKEALAQGEGFTERQSDTLGRKTIYYAKRLSDGTFLRVASEQRERWLLFIGILSPMGALILIVIIVAAAISSTVAKKIVNPINGINLDSGDISEPYEELAPLLSKINIQNKKIGAQISELEQREKEFGLITSNMSEGLVIADDKTNIVFCNESALRLLGLSEIEAEEFVRNKEHESVLALCRIEDFICTVEEALSGKNSTKRLCIKDRYCDVFASPVYSDGTKTEADAERAGVVLLLLDVTEREQREVLRREFTSNVSHELKTPLTTIYGVADMLASGMVKPDDVTSFAISVKTEAGRLITLIDDIIKLSRLDEASTSELPELEKVNLYTLAEKVTERLAPVAEKSKVSLSVEGDKDSARIEGVPHILDEMLYNLCDNGIKYNKEGGSVCVKVMSDGGVPKISVEDTGIGIPSEYTDRVFERFFRVDKSHSKKAGGTGLGLSIVKHAVMRHNGRLKLESTLGKGTRITISFPKQN